MTKKYVVRLTDAERRECEAVVSVLTGASQKARRARILWKADADGPAWTDERISEAFGCRTQTVENVRQRFVTESFELALEGKNRESPPTAGKLDGEGELDFPRNRGRGVMGKSNGRSNERCGMDVQADAASKCFNGAGLVQPGGPIAPAVYGTLMSMRFNGAGLVQPGGRL